MDNLIKHNFENLEIWKLGMDLADEVCDLIKKFPDYERFGLSSQISRASVSMPSNIAEGSSGSQPSFARYIGISLGSSFELQSQLILSKRRKYISEQEFKVIIKKLNKFQRMAISFQKRLLS